MVDTDPAASPDVFAIASRQLSRRSLLTGAALGVAVAATSLAIPTRASAATNDGPFPNGQIPRSSLTEVGGHYFASNAVPGLVALRAAFNAARGHQLIINSGYRDLEGQWATWYAYQAGGNLAAYPGTSNHGKGIAADFGGNVYRGPANQYPPWSPDTADHRWMRENAPSFGWTWEGRWFEAQVEPWHWEYTGQYPPVPETPAPQSKDDDVRVLVANTEGSQWAVVFSNGSQVVLTSGAQVRGHQKIAYVERNLSWDGNGDAVTARFSGEEFASLGLGTTTWR